LLVAKHLVPTDHSSTCHQMRVCASSCACLITQEGPAVALRPCEMERDGEVATETPKLPRYETESACVSLFGWPRTGRPVRGGSLKCSDHRPKRRAQRKPTAVVRIFFIVRSTLPPPLPPAPRSSVGLGCTDEAHRWRRQSVCRKGLRIDR